MKTATSLTSNRLQRWHLLQMVIDGHIALLEASRMLSISYRHAKRLKQAVMREGLQGLVHGNTGKKPCNAVTEQTQGKIIKLARTRYASLNDTRLVEKLSEAHGITLSRETVRKILRSAGIKARPVQKISAARNKSSILPPEGMMILWGGLTGRWFGKRSPECCFMAAVDVATMRCLAARFFQQGDSKGYLWLLKKIVTTFGIPVSFCQHSSNAILRRDKIWTIQEQLQGAQNPTQTARALRELGIVQYLESKSRVATISSRFKEALMSEIQQNRVADMDQANRLFMPQFIERFNTRFARGDDNPVKAWRQVSPDLDVERICGFQYETVVDAGNRAAVGDIVIEIPPGENRISYAKARVDVRQLLDGSWRVYYRGKKIAEHASTPVKEIEMQNQKTKDVLHAPELHYLMVDADQQDIF